MESNTKCTRKENPGLKANPISRILFIYVIPIFWKNYRNELTEDDLFNVLDEHKSSKLGDELEDVWKKQHTKHPKYALHLALLKIHGLKLAVLGVLRFMTETTLIVVLPFAIGRLVSYFEKGPPEVSRGDAFIHAGLILSVLLFDVIINHPAMLSLMHMSMKMRVSCCSLIYRKSLKLSRTALGDTTIGQVVNLLSNDVRKFDEGFVICHYIWIAPIQAAIGTYLLYQIIGVSAFAGMGFLLLFIPVQVYLGKLNSVVRLKTALRTDERVRLMNEILSGIQVIKMYTWEKPFAKLVSLARRFEIKAVRIHYYIEAILFALGMFVTRTCIFISIIVYVYMGYNITADTAYAVTAVYSVLRPIITIVFSYSMIILAEIHISIGRLQKFLSLDEITQIKDKNLEITALMQNEHQKRIISVLPRITFKNVSAKWLEDSADNNLTDINLNLEGPQLVGVIGPVASGKSTLLSTILKDLTIVSGYVNVIGKISYSCQDPWLFSGSIKQNILFGDDYNEERYQAVIKTCCLESDLKILPYGDRTLVGERGKSLSGGQKARLNLARCVYKRADIYLLDDPLSAVDTKVGKQLYDNCIKTFLSDKLCVLVTHQLQYLSNVDRIIILKDGQVIEQGRFEDLQHSSLNFAKLLQQFCPTEEKGNSYIKAVKLRQNSEVEIDDEVEVLECKETLTKGNINLGVYAAYLKAGGGLCVMFLLGLMIISAHTVGKLGDYFLSYWVNLEQSTNELSGVTNSTIDRNCLIYTYSGIIMATIVLALSHALFFFMFFMRASINVHDKIFKTISYATMRFFNDNPTGRILNRFAKDIGVIDEQIPFILIDVVDVALVFSGAIILASMVNIWILLPTTVLLGMCYVVRKFYWRTSRSVKRIEGITRTPIFNHMTATLNGLSTIRAFKAEQLLINEFDAHQDLHSSAWYLYIVSRTAFSFYIDIVCDAFIAFIAYGLILLNRGYFGGDIGLIITQLIDLSGLLQWGMSQWAELENNMISAERIMEYSKFETEPARDTLTNYPNNWPENGKIVFKNVSLRYKPNEVNVLKNLNFIIRPKEKVGIVGRTAAGKTSIIAALFQLYDIEGSIIIDDVDTTKIPLRILRSNISIIPQDPVLFSGTLRKNLDPFNDYNDDTLWSALERVELKDVVEDSTGGLNMSVAESGSNFSVGQRQLVCLARAIIRNNKILVMDEATANVDPNTDLIIQRAIRKSFIKCTVITIAHRLHTVMDSDRVVVMDHGEIVEFDHPHNLLQKPNGIFANMVETTGNALSQTLKSVAEENYTTSETNNS